MTSQSELSFRRYDLPPAPETEQPAHLSGLMWSPLKSGRLIYADRLYVGRDGIRPSQESAVSDRSLMIIDARHPDGKLVTQREKARLALLEVNVKGNTVQLTFRADQAAQKLREKLSDHSIQSHTFEVQFAADDQHPERSTMVHTTKDVLGIDQGDEVAAWLSSIVGQEVRLVFQKPDAPRQRTEQIPDLTEAATILRFQDSFPLTALSHTTLNIFNQRLAEAHPDWPQFAPIHFRMNLLIAGQLNEHLAVGKFLKIGEVYFYVYRPKERCPMPAVDPDAGVMRGEVGFSGRYLTVLKELHPELGITADIPEELRVRRLGKAEKERLEPKPLLGVDMIPVNEGYLDVNAPIEVLDQLPADL